MKIIFRVIVLTLMVLCAACGPTQVFTSGDVPQGPAAWIDAPLDGSNLPQAEYHVVSHASDPDGVSAFELSVDGNIVMTDNMGGDQSGKTIVHISQPWLPPASGTYLIEVRAKNKNGVFGLSAYAHVTVGGVRQMSPTVEASATVTATSTIAPTTIPTSVPTAIMPTAVGLQTTNCHTGPGGIYDVNGTLAKNQGVQIEGINSDKTWVWVQHPNFKGSHCWLSIPFVQIQGSLEGLPLIPAPPLPVTPTPIPTATIYHH
jgi:uncharacterized protein YgiM (DUF1202 family)